MKKFRIKKVLICLAVIAVVGIEIMEINSMWRMKNQIENMKREFSDLGSLSYDLERTFQDYVGNPDAIIEKSDQHLLHRDLENKTVTMEFSVEPRQVSQSRTAVLQMDDRSFPMTMDEDGIYHADVVIDILTPVQQADVVFQENGQEKVEQVNFTGSYGKSFFPWLSGGFSGSGSTKDKGEEHIFRFRGEVSVYTDQEEPNALKLQDITVIVEEQGKVIRELPVPEGKSEIPFKEDIVIPHGGGRMDVYVIAKDNMGFQYRVIIRQFVFNEEGEFALSEEEDKYAGDAEPIGTYIVTDKDGKEIYRDV